MRHDMISSSVCRADDGFLFRFCLQPDLALLELADEDAVWSASQEALQIGLTHRQWHGDLF
jgi:hypothetical protein